MLDYRTRKEAVFPFTNITRFRWVDKFSVYFVFQKLYYIIIENREKKLLAKISSNRMNRNIVFL